MFLPTQRNPLHNTHVKHSDTDIIHTTVVEFHTSFALESQSYFVTPLKPPREEALVLIRVTDQLSAN